MPDMPVPINHVVAAIYEALVKRARGGDSAGVSMSSAVNPCDRAIWYAFRWASPAEPVDGQRQSVFDTAAYWESRLIEELRLIGCEVFGEQVKVQLADGHLRGKLDAITTGVPGAPCAEHVVECKALKAENFRAVAKHGAEKAKPEHYAQIQLYMHATSIERGLYFIVNRDDDARHTERLHYDVVYCLKLVERIERIVYAPIPPPRNESWACQFCKSKAQCLDGQWSRVNCRTCMHASPVVEGEWLCQKHNKRLDYRMQQAGCPDHRFVPALVHGEQLDVQDGDLIVYRLADGSSWIDGMRESV